MPQTPLTIHLRESTVSQRPGRPRALRTQTPPCESPGIDPLQPDPDSWTAFPNLELLQRQADCTGHDRSRRLQSP